MPAKKRPPKDAFSATEVGTLIESFRTDIRIVAEGVADLRTKVDSLAADVADLRIKVDTLIPMVRQNTEDIAMIKVELRAIRADMKTFDTRLKVVEAKLAMG